MKVERGIPITKFSLKSLSMVEDLKQLQTAAAPPNEKHQHPIADCHNFCEEMQQYMYE